MTLRAAILLVLAMAPVTFAQSPQACPWLSAGTAANILGGSVTTVAHSDSSWSGSCDFTVTNDPIRKVDVMVGKTKPHLCESDATPLNGIGNQAEFCSHLDADGRQVQAVTGRVRGAWFVVTVVLPPAAGNQPPSDVSGIQFLAEQVAGNLY